MSWSPRSGAEGIRYYRYSIICLKADHLFLHYDYRENKITPPENYSATVVKKITPHTGGTPRRCSTFWLVGLFVLIRWRHKRLHGLLNLDPDYTAAPKVHT